MIQQSQSWAYIEKNTVQKYTCTLRFIAVLSPIAKTWKQHKYPSPDEWIKIM